MNPQMTTFEERIKNTFLRYGRVPFVIIIAMTLLIIAGGYGYTNLFLVKQVQNEVSSVNEHVHKAVEETFSLVDKNLDFADFIEKPGKYSQTLYQNYYRLNSKVDSNSQIVIFHDERPLFITMPSLVGSYYNQVYNSYLLDELSEYQTIITMVSDIKNPNLSYLIFGKRIVQDDVPLNVLVYIDTQYYMDVVSKQRSNHLVISDRFKNVIATSSNDFITSLSKFNPNNEGSIKLAHSKYKVYSNSYYNDQINVSILVQNQELYIIAIFLIGITTAALYLMQRINKLSAQKAGREVSESVSILMEGVKRLEEGDLSSKVEITTHDEFETLAEAFNSMSDQLLLLMSTNERLVELRKNAEIKQLEAQFNPHFLYNSLETVRYLIDEDPKTAELLVLNTSKLLRYSIEPSSKEVPFRDDMRYIELYLNINKVRLGDRFNYTIEIEEEVLDMNLPKLILQPLIENCLKHGYRSKDTLNVGIIGYEKDGYIYIHVVDDGDGMSPQLVESFNSFDTETLISKTRYGVLSIIQRIHLMYGNNGSVYVQSDDSGTHIILCIPKGGLEIV